MERRGSSASHRYFETFAKNCGAATELSYLTHDRVVTYVSCARMNPYGITRRPSLETVEEAEREGLLGLSPRDSEDEYFPRTWPPTRSARVEADTSKLPVYKTIHRIRRDIIAYIDDPYSLEQLNSPDLISNVVRPLVEKLYKDKNIAIIYCLLVNRLQFLREQSSRGHHQTVSGTRALLCGVVAQRILRRFDDDNPGPAGLLLLANILVGGFIPFQNAPQEVMEENAHAVQWVKQKRGGTEGRLTALELAIISEAKFLLGSPVCQKVVESIYKGRIIYTPTSFIDILPDHYKYQPVALYDPLAAPILNQYRLNVPRTRSHLEVAQFVILIVLYFWVMISRHTEQDNMRTLEVVFCVYTLGWVLDQLASVLEHGWYVYTQNLWAFLDVSFSCIYFAYIVLRARAISNGDAQLTQQAFDVLCLGAPVLIPRLAFNFLSGNMLFLSLRAMMADFAILVLLATWCFAGFLLGMFWLSSGTHSITTISKWMIWVWFGLDGTGIDRSPDFSPFFGPLLMILFALLGNTLFITIMVSMLSHTFSTIASDSTREIQYRQAVLTFEGVKSDAIFAYQPPTNILAIVLLLPLKFLVSPRWFHKINVSVVRFVNAPILLVICYLERRYLWKRDHHRAEVHTGQLTKTKSRWSFWNFQRFSVHGDIRSVFDIDPPMSVIQEIIKEDQASTSPVVKAQPNQTSHGGWTTHNPLLQGQSLTPGPRKKAHWQFDKFLQHADSAIQAQQEVLKSNEDQALETRLKALEHSIHRMERLLEAIHGASS